MLSIETVCEIGMNACIDMLGCEFVIAHRESGTVALGVCEDGVFCFIGIETDALSQNTDNTLVLDSTSAFTHQASCFVLFMVN